MVQFYTPFGEVGVGLSFLYLLAYTCNLLTPWNDEHVQLLQTISINQLHVTKCQVAHGFYLGKVTK